MKHFSVKSYLQFSRTQRIGLLMLFTLIVVSQLVYFYYDFNQLAPEKPQPKSEWLSLKMPTDTVSRKKKKQKIYPFNPNFITDFKGYMLGMSVEQIDRLLAFRKTERYVNSAEEFQAVTKVSDSLLDAIAPYFKFPDWTKNKTKFKAYEKPEFKKKEVKVPIDINLATAEDLKKVYGIGDGLSERILKEKEKFGGFVSMDQMSDIWGLSPEVIEKLQQEFTITKQPEITKIKINDATFKELMQFPYFKYKVAKSIVTFRTMNAKIAGVEDLLKISDFPIDRINIIALYLEF